MRVANFTDKHISKFTQEDTIYLQTISGGYSYVFLCQFLKFDKNVVNAKIIAVPEPHLHSNVGREISARIDRCHLYGISNDEVTLRCHWFIKSGYTN